MPQSLRRRPSVVVALSLLCAVVVGATLAWATAGRGTNQTSFTDSDLAVPETLRAVVEGSPVIVRGTLVNERVQVTELRSPVTGQVAGERTELVRTFEIGDVLRGDVANGEALDVLATTAMKTWGENRERQRAWEVEFVAMERGRDYVLFLTTFSEETGEALGLNGAVSVALVDGDRLVFLLTDEYREAAKDAGFDQPGVAGLQGSFDVVMSELRDLVASVPYRHAATEPEPTEVARISAIQAQQAIAVGVWQQAMAGDFRSPLEIEARMAELGFDPTALGDDPLACEGVERLFSDLGFVVDLGCP
jgi:hypothetical protein